MKVLKFGSASIATAEKLKNVASIVSREKQGIIVLSAMQGTAEKLTEISEYFYKRNYEGASEIITRLEIDHLTLVSNLYHDDKIKRKAIDFITSKIDYIRTFAKKLFTLFEQRIVMAQGELISSELFLLLLEDRGVSATLIPALSFIRIDRNSEPDINFINENLQKAMSDNSQNPLYITQGYIATNAYGEIDDLNKGGSDYTATLIGAAIKASEIQIWSNVHLMQNNDSLYVENIHPIKQLSFDEAAELAYFGSKMLHPNSILPAKLANIPVRLMCTEHQEEAGTLISNHTEKGVIKAVAARENITAINIKSGKMLLAHGFLRKVFEVFEQYQTPIDMLTTSEVGISLTIDDRKHLSSIIDDLKKYGTVLVDNDMVIVSVIGDLNWENIGVEYKILSLIKEMPIRMISYGGSNYNISFLVKKNNTKEILEQLNSKLF